MEQDNKNIDVTDNEEKKEMVVRKNDELAIPRTGLSVKGELSVMGELAVKGELAAIQELTTRGELSIKGELVENNNGERIIIVESVKAAVAYLQETKGNILTATGALEIYEYTKLKDYKERIYSRVLPNGRIIKACEELGITGRHLIGMKSPFSKMMNYVMLKDYDIRYLVTRDSEISSGFIEKMEAALELGVTMIVVASAYNEENMKEEEVIKLLQNKPL